VVSAAVRSCGGARHTSAAIRAIGVSHEPPACGGTCVVSDAVRSCAEPDIRLRLSVPTVSDVSRQPAVEMSVVSAAVRPCAGARHPPAAIRANGVRREPPASGGDERGVSRSPPLRRCQTSARGYSPTSVLDVSRQPAAGTCVVSDAVRSYGGARHTPAAIGDIGVRREPPACGGDVRGVRRSPP
jgi:hypothetical protein